MRLTSTPDCRGVAAWLSTRAGTLLRGGAGVSTFQSDVSCDDGLLMSDPSVRYTVIRSLGKGGMGELFLAEDAVLERPPAIGRR